jgi:peptide-methionine (S)-S-oxide reductase
VVRTRVGYAGGQKKNPTYHDLGDHTECIQIDYDPSVLNYEQLLDIFWNAHNPAGPAWSRQYASLIFYAGDEEKRQAEASRARISAKRGAISTEIVPAGEFYRAEDYHQKYYLRHSSTATKWLRAIYPRTPDFVDSTAAARLNALFGGDLTKDRFAELATDLGLNAETFGELARR